MANMSYQSVATASELTFAGNSLVCNKPSGTVSGDLMVASFFSIISGSTSPTHTLPAGWTSIDSDTALVIGGSYSCRLELAYRVAGGSEGASYTFQTSAAANLVLSIARYDNVDTGSPYDTTSKVTGAGFTCTLPSLTTAAANSMLVGTVWGLGAGAGTTFTSTDMTERADHGSVWLGDVFQAAAGGSGTKQVFGGDSGAYIGIMAAFKSEEGVATPALLSVLMHHDVHL